MNAGLRQILASNFIEAIQNLDKTELSPDDLKEIAAEIKKQIEDLDLDDSLLNTVTMFNRLMPTCGRCDSALLIRCSDATCPFSDCDQNDPKGWADHPEKP